jgi:hypothetical protein
MDALLETKMFSFLRKTSLYLLAIPTLLTVIGAASNQAVLIANHDTFPVLVNDAKATLILTHQAGKPDTDFRFRPTPAQEVDNVVMLDEVHCLMTPQTHLNALADVFDLGSIYSIGDFSLILGDWLWAFAFPLFVFDTTRKLAKS